MNTFADIRTGRLVENHGSVDRNQPAGPRVIGRTDIGFQARVTEASKEFLPGIIGAINFKSLHHIGGMLKRFNRLTGLNVPSFKVWIYMLF